MMIRDGATVLFIGDSITDCGRSRENLSDLGRGYALMAAARFQAAYPGKNVTFLNRGISGNRVKDLQARWQADCLELKPDCVSILIGINDVWRRYDSNDPTAVEAYEEGYRDLLAQVCDSLKVPVVMLEPFVLPTPPDRVAWREDLDPKIDAARRLAREFDAVYVPMDGVFNAASTRYDPAYWAADGVHPTPAGHALIAREWLKAVGAADA